MKQCYLCHVKGVPLERHHVFNGSNRNKSEKYGYVVLLCRDCHTGGQNAVHRNRAVMVQLKKEFQRKAMAENGWNKEDFIREFGRNYI